MSGLVEGRVAVITGAGRGIGREHALLLASRGAKVVVNDLGGDVDGSGGDVTPAQSVVDEIVSAGGEAVVNGSNVANFDEAGAMIQQAIDTFGGLDILINNAGILRDRMVFKMEEADWDAVINVHLKGTFAPTSHASKYWREQSKAGNQPDARIINTSSPSGIYGNIGQVELRRGEGRDRRVHRDHRDGTRQLRRDLQRHRTGRIHTNDPGPARLERNER